MPCYHPRHRIENLWKWETAKDGHKYHPAIIQNGDLSPDWIEKLKRQDCLGHYRHQIIGCDKCIGCRLDYSRQWANRGYLESLMHKNTYFITLTYDKKHLIIPDFIVDHNDITWTNPNDGSWKGTLVPKHFKTFINTFRKIMERDYNQTGIRFMGCGEYGTQGDRPHYHIIIFGADLPKETFYNPRIINKEVYYQNKIIERAWTKGISNISVATWNTIAYVARYITKKINGEMSDEYYGSQGKYKEFLRASTHPGIGEPYYRAHWQEIYRTDSITIKNKNGVTRCKPPKYFDELFEKEHPNEWWEIQRKRQIDARNQNQLKSYDTSLFVQDMLEIEERTKQEQSLQLLRNLERGSQ